MWVGGWKCRVILRLYLLSRSKYLAGNWMGGWVDGWMDGKAGLRIVYSNQKEHLYEVPTLKINKKVLKCRS